MKVERVEFVERLDPGSGSFSEILTGTLRRFALDGAGLVGHVRVSLARRLSVCEIARLRLEPAMDQWYEVRATATIRVGHRTTTAGPQMAIQTSAARPRAATRL